MSSRKGEVSRVQHTVGFAFGPERREFLESAPPVGKQGVRLVEKPHPAAEVGAAPA